MPISVNDTTYTNVFGGNMIQTADSSYAAYKLLVPFTLHWQTEFFDIDTTADEIFDGIAYDFMEIYADNADVILFLPDASLASPGSNFVISNTNISGHDLKVYKNDSVLLVTMQADVNSIIMFTLTDNSTKGGQWSIIPFSSGVPTNMVTSVGLNVDETNGNITVQSDTTNPITRNGTFHLGLGKDLLAFTKISNNEVGIVYKDSDVNDNPTYIITDIIAGSDNVTVDSPNGGTGQYSIDLGNTITVGNVIAANTATATCIGTFVFANNVLTFTALDNGTFNYTSLTWSSTNSFTFTSANNPVVTKNSIIQISGWGNNSRIYLPTNIVQNEGVFTFNLINVHSQNAELPTDMSNLTNLSIMVY